MTNLFADLSPNRTVFQSMFPKTSLCTAFKKLGLLSFIVGASSGLIGCTTPATQPSSSIIQSPILQHDQFTTSDGYRLPMLNESARPAQPKAAVIALHGFNDYSRAFSSMCQYLNTRDIACYAYDQRGFGNTKYRGIWPEDGVLESDLLEMTKAIKQRYSQIPIYLVGESMGGAVILSAMAKSETAERREIDGVVLLAPAVWGRETQPWYQRWALALAVRIAPSWTPTGESLEIKPTDNIEALKEMSRDELVIKETRIDAIYGLTNLMDQALEASGKIKTLPSLILYGKNDEVIPADPTCDMLARFNASNGEVNFQLYPNGYHMLTRDLQADVVFEDVYRWISSATAEPLSMATAELCSDQGGG